MNIDYLYRNVIRPMLFNMDPEEAHKLVHDLLKKSEPVLGLLGQPPQHKNLATKFCGTAITNPIGLAAGFDKNADLLNVLGKLGFGFAEVGSITAQARSGNPKPRLFRLPDDEAIINRMGLNGIGADAVCQRLASANFSLPVGINIAKTNDPSITGDLAIEDILHSFRCARDLPITHVTLNVSCPNTKEGAVCETKFVSSLLEEVSKSNAAKVPVFLKLSTDSSDDFICSVVELAKLYGIAGFVCANTTNSRDNLTTDKRDIESIGAGGLSGAPLKKRALKLCERVNFLRSETQVIIGCGGISSGRDAYEFMQAGASVVQLYSGMVFHGPGLPNRIAKELSAILTTERRDVNETRMTIARLSY